MSEKRPEPKQPRKDAMERYKIFAAEYIANGFKKIEAYRKAYPNCSTKQAAKKNAEKILANEWLDWYIEQETRETLSELDMDKRKALQILTDLVEADPTEFFEVVTDSCRYCHGKDHQYQFTQGEWGRLTEHWAAECFEAKEKNKELPPKPQERGGLGFNPTRDPHPECPECFGRGVSNTLIKPTASLSPQAKRLLSSVKRDNNGVVVGIADNLRAQAIQTLYRKAGFDKANIDLGVNKDNPLAAMLNAVSGNTLKPQGG